MKRSELGTAIVEIFLLVGLVLLVGYTAIGDFGSFATPRCPVPDGKLEREITSDLNADGCVDFEDLIGMAYGYGAEFGLSDLRKLAGEYKACPC